MIAIVVNSAVSFFEGVQDGVVSYAMEHAGEGWNDLVSIPWAIARRLGLSHKNLRGMIVQLWIDAEEEILLRGIPSVNVSEHLPNPLMPSVLPDNEGIGREAAKYFLDRGYRSFGFVGDVSPAAASEKRGRGFVAAVQQAGYGVSWFGEFPAELPQGAVREHEDMASWVRSMAKPAAAFAYNDFRANDLCAAAVAARVSVPEQLAILGVDNDFHMHHGGAGISSIELPLYEIGYRAAALLERLMAGGKPEQYITLLPPVRVITRATTDTKAVHDDDVLDAIRFIREHAHESIDVGHVSEQVALSRRTLERRFRTALGITPNMEIQRVRIEHAKRLLSATQMSIPEVADATGFLNRNRLFVAFKAATGLAPLQFRSAMQQSETSRL